MTDAIEAGARADYERYDCTRAKDTPWGELSPDSRNRWIERVRPIIEAAIASGALVPASAVAAFLRAWDSLPSGHHSARAISDWLNGSAMKAAIGRLRQLNLSTATEGHSDTKDEVFAAVAEMRERCIQAVRDERLIDPVTSHDQAYNDALDHAEQAIRQLDLSPACGEYVVVPRVATQMMRLAAVKAWSELPAPSEGITLVFDRIWTAMLHAATRTGGGK